MSRYKRYERYKDSGVEWIGEIPEHWGVSKIKFTTYVKGRIGWQGLRADEFIDEGPYLVTGTDFIDGLVNWDSCYHISMERYNEAPPIQLRENDLLITKDGTIGKVAIVKNKPKYAILNSGIFVTRPQNSAYLTEFMYWILNSQVFNRFIEYMSLGSTIVHLYQQTFENFSFPITNLNEQKTIVDFLNKKTSEIDDLIADKERLIELLQEKRQAIITEAVTKGLNPNVRMKDSGIEWIGEIPEHWELNKLKYVIRNGKEGIKIGPFGSSLKLDDMDESNPYKVYGQENIINNDFTRGNRFITQEKFNEMCGYQLFSGDIVISMMGTIGKCKVIPLGIQPGIMDSHLIRLRTNNGVMLPKFLEYLIDNTNYVKEQMNYMSKGSIMSGLNSSIIKEIILVIPSVVEQKEIIDFLEQKTAEIDDLVTKIKIQIQKLKEYRQSLISEAVTGKIDVRVFENKDEVIYSEQDSSPCRELTHVAE